MQTSSRLRKALLPAILGLFAAHFAAASEPPAAPAAEKPIVLRTMGSFFFGGEVKRLENGVTFHGDHGCTQYYITENARSLPIIMWHGIGQSGKTFESTPDGREGYQAILTRRDWPIYIIDQPRRGRAGRSSDPSVASNAPTVLYESAAWDAFRFGLWAPPKGPRAFGTLQMPLDGWTVDQFFRQQMPYTGPEPVIGEMAKTVAKLIDLTGPAILMTHSRSGQFGWAVAMERPELVRAVVAYEPGHCVFPEGETPPDVPRGEMHVETMGAPTVPVAEFEKLTKMPILVVFGDNIATEPSNIFNSEVWRSSSTRGGSSSRPSTATGATRG